MGQGLVTSDDASRYLEPMFQYFSAVSVNEYKAIGPTPFLLFTDRMRCSMARWLFTTPRYFTCGTNG